MQQEEIGLSNPNRVTQPGERLMLERVSSMMKSMLSHRTQTFGRNKK